jgi:hypothetical protein
MKLLKVAGSTFALLIAVLIGVVCFVAYQAEYYQIHLGRPLDRDLGFEHGSPYVFFGESSREVFTLHPIPGGILATAGVRDSDIPIDFSITAFYNYLHRNRGSQVTVRVMDGGDGPPANQRLIRTTTFLVPPAK